MDIGNQLRKFRVTGKMKIRTFVECSAVGDDYE